jgi:aspartate ammonia-lyase
VQRAPPFALALALASVNLQAQAAALAPPPKVRIEHDLLGEKEIPASVLYGVQTARAIENFQISGLALTDYSELINGFAQVQMAAARGNTDAGKMKKETRDAIIKAGNAILAGNYREHFLVDPYQGGLQHQQRHT